MLQSSNALLACSDWIVGTLTGALGVMLAVLAIAGVGFAMLQGRLAVRSGVRVILGCFVLFGAPVIAKALSGGVGQAPAQTVEVYNALPSPPIAIPAPPPPNTDPYAGASVPM
ncbi:TrbC/VirB2 family protein [Novosphingobium naphthalenivorans]|uniref:TrbC/VirB2 family protein n=1 Tax=Novosphingobium naphthalenivorans TaxID=273168 RepID=UPI000A05B555|nr:TrbC/VirB2 family protein [Novosphingobium naphthalenivorans]